MSMVTHSIVLQHVFTRVPGVCHEPWAMYEALNGKHRYLEGLPAI